MNTTHIGLIVALTLTGLSGCALPGPNADSYDSGNLNSVGTLSVVETLGQAPVGDRLVLPSGNDLDALEARVIDEYDAASGKVCRRVELNQSAGEIRVICLGKDSQWTLTRVLNSQAFRQWPEPNEATVADNLVIDSPKETTAIPEKKELVSIINASARNADSHLREVGSGETLWRFSKRVTGNALNWNAIAEVNQIDDARTVTTGMVLKVPAHLLRMDRQ